MTVTTVGMVNESYNPSEMEESVLDVLKNGREEGRPWGYTTPSVSASIINTRRQYTSRALQGLVKAGWVESVGTGVYRFVEDPREEDG